MSLCFSKGKNIPLPLRGGCAAAWEKKQYAAAGTAPAAKRQRQG